MLNGADRFSKNMWVQVPRKFFLPNPLIDEKPLCPVKGNTACARNTYLEVKYVLYKAPPQ